MQEIQVPIEVETEVTEQPKPVEPRLLYQHPKYYAVCLVGTRRLVPVKRCKVTDSALAGAELTEATLNGVTMLVHLVRDADLMAKLTPYTATV